MERLKNNKNHIIISSVLTLLPILIGLALYNRLPESVPTHFSISGEADQYNSKNFAVFFMPLLLLLINCFCIWGTAQDPKNSRVSDRVYTMIMYIVPVVSLFTSSLIYLKALDLDININRIMMYFLSLTFIIIGNYLPKTRQNYTIGIKTPWALDDVSNWDKTNRLGGYLFVAAGMIVFICSFFPSDVTLYVLLGSIFAITLILYIYSYSLYRNKKHAEN